MIINYEGKSYEWDQDVMVSEDAVIFQYTGLHFVGWTEALDNPTDPNYIKALQAFMWMLRKRAGELTDIKAQDFAIGKFVRAIQEGSAQVAPEEEEVPKDLQDSAPTTV
jgi:hypothetical protein